MRIAAQMLRAVYCESTDLNLQSIGDKLNRKDLQTAVTPIIKQHIRLLEARVIFKNELGTKMQEVANIIDDHSKTQYSLQGGEMKTLFDHHELWIEDLLNKRLDPINKKLETIDDQMRQIIGKTEENMQDIKTLNSKVDVLSKQTESMQGQMKNMQGQMGSVETRMGTLEGKMDQILQLLTVKQSPEKEKKVTPFFSSEGMKGP